MSPFPQSHSALSPSPELFEMLERFEQAWQQGPPDLAGLLSNLPAADKVPMLRELIKIDLEYRWRNGSMQAKGESPSALPLRPMIEDYLALHPELAAPSIDLIVEEYRVRRRWGDKPGPQDYMSRFPHLANELASQLAKVEDELRREEGAQPTQAPPEQNQQAPSAPIALPHVRLTLTHSSFSGLEYTFAERSTCIVGKAADCGVRFPVDADHATISRHHCLFDISPPLIRVRDLGSRNGTYVNGEMIGMRETPQLLPTSALPAREVDLKHGDEVQLGRLGLVNLRITIENPVSLETEVPGQTRMACVHCGGALAEGSVGEAICERCQAQPGRIVERMIAGARAGDDSSEGLQDYTITRELGRGGMGAVFLARHRQTREEVALKVMLPQVAINPRMKQLFMREIENTRLLQHPNVVRLRELGDADGAFFFTMDYCSGGSVQDLVKARGQPLHRDEAVDILRKALAGLDYAHNLEVPVSLPGGGVGRATGLVHRDLKPANLFLSSPQHPWQVKIGDYGLAKAFDTAGLSGLTWTGAACGTPHYMPRAQVVDFRFSRPEVDVWALAACFYFLLTKQPPRDFQPKVDVWRTILETKPVPIRKRNPAIPKRIAQFVDHALTEEPEMPFKTAKQLRLALDDAVR